MSLVEDLLRLCQKNITPEEYLLSLDEMKYSRKVDNFLLSATPTIAIISLFCGISICMLTMMAVTNKRLSKRHYGLILNNYCCDIITSIIIIGVGTFSNFTKTTFTIYAMAFLIITFSVTHSSIYNVIHCFLVKDSQKQFLTFRKSCSPAKISMLTFLQWGFAMVYSLAFIPLMIMFYSKETMFKLCSFNSCQLPLLYISIVVIGVFIISVIILYASTALSLRQSIKNEESRNETPLSKGLLFKFLAHGGRVALYIIITILILSGCIVILVTHIRIHDLSKKPNDCSVNEFLKLGNTLHTVCGGIVMLWLVKMIFDPVILLTIDYHDLLPWLNQSGQVQRLRAESIYSLAQAQGLDRKKRVIHCAITSMEKPFKVWDMKN
uniref:G-protein coupled receptors family 1 profile domain-containing protein n=1 Tax=Strongyloides stercoralis TaxID=6248 RepID=A0A0K0E630_STRER